MIHAPTIFLSEISTFYVFFGGKISTFHVWVTLKNISNKLYSLQGISYDVSGVGEPMLTTKP